MLYENGLQAELACVTACRPAYPGHNNNSINPLLFTIHDIEDGRATITPDDTALMIGDAGSNGGIMGDAWLDKVDTQASVHFGVYPGGVAQCLPLNLGCWGAGPSANSVALQAEQSGVASYGPGEWLTPAGVQQLNNIAELYAELCVHFGWPQPHWATDAEIQGCVNGSTASGLGGATYHHDWTRNYPNDTTHTDPGANYPGKSDGPYTPGQVDPQDQFMPLAVAKWRALTGQTPTPTPAPKPEGLFMSLTPDEEKTILAAAQLVTGAAHPAPGTPMHTISDIAGDVAPFVNGTTTMSTSLAAAMSGITAAINKFAAAVAASHK